MKKYILFIILSMCLGIAYANPAPVAPQSNLLICPQSVSGKLTQYTSTVTQNGTTWTYIGGQSFSNITLITPINTNNTITFVPFSTSPTIYCEGNTPKGPVLFAWKNGSNFKAKKASTFGWTFTNNPQ